jgi:hypothetical protein
LVNETAAKIATVSIPALAGQVEDKKIAGDGEVSNLGYHR